MFEVSIIIQYLNIFWLFWAVYFTNPSSISFSMADSVFIYVYSHRSFFDSFNAKSARVSPISST